MPASPVPSFTDGHIGEPNLPSSGGGPSGRGRLGGYHGRRLPLWSSRVRSMIDPSPRICRRLQSFTVSVSAGAQKCARLRKKTGRFIGGYSMPSVSAFGLRGMLPAIVFPEGA
jgi:hypothetical protein